MRLLTSRDVDVAILDVDVPAASRIAAMAIACDVVDPGQVEDAMARVVAEWGRIDYLVACAGVLRETPITSTPAAEWDAILDIHLRGTFLCAQAAEKAMYQQRSGRMVFLSSDAALGVRGYSAYSAAKGAIQALARTLALDLAPYGIRVNAVAPGIIDTDLSRAAVARVGRSWDEFVAVESSRIALRRVGRPEEVASVIAFLCGADSDFITGQTIYATGGP